MILPDDTPESPTKSRAGPISEVSEEEYIPPPPAYPGPPAQSSSYQYQNTDVEAQVSDTRTPIVQNPRYASTSNAPEEVESAAKRFFKAFVIALLIYAFAISFMRTAVAVVRGRSNASHRIPLPNRSDGKILKCNSADVASFVHQPGAQAIPITSYLLPLSADVLYIFGRGDLTHGSITFSAIHDPSIPDGNVRVDITPIYNSKIALASANICLLERKPGERGIAILTPSSWFPSTDLSFSVDVRIPIHGGDTLKIKAFETHLPLFKHMLSGLSGKVSFGTLDLFSENMSIQSGHLAADDAIIRTSNARISGVYSISRSLLLHTSNQAITANVVLYHDGTSEVPTNLTMETANSQIDSTVSLLTTAPENHGGSYIVSAKTENGLLDLSFPSQPAESTLVVSAATINSPATVHLHPAYEGAVELATTHGPHQVDFNSRAQDPMGRGRSRVWVLTERTARSYRGWFSWGAPREGEGGQGSVSVRTQNAAVQLMA